MLGSFSLYCDEQMVSKQGRFAGMRSLQGCSKRLSGKAARSLNTEAYWFSTLRWTNDRERSQRPFSAAL